MFSTKQSGCKIRFTRFFFRFLMVVFLFSSFFLQNLNLISDSVEKERIYDYQFHTITSNIKDFCLKIQLHDFP